jgi:hypothetical protein
MIGSSRQERAPASRAAMRATSALNSVTYIERSVANGLPAMAWSNDTSRTSRSWSRVSILTTARPPCVNVKVKVIVFASNDTSLMFTIGRPSVSTGPIRKDEP